MTLPLNNATVRACVDATCTAYNMVNSATSMVGGSSDDYDMIKKLTMCLIFFAFIYMVVRSSDDQRRY